MSQTVAEQDSDSGGSEGGTGSDGDGESKASRGPLQRVRDALAWLFDRPGRTVVVVAVVGLIVRHAWLSTKPLSSGDWKWPTSGRILNWFPWPSVWMDTLGFSGQNRFFDAFRFPVYAVNGMMASAGATWTVIEKVVYFVPFAILLPVAGWLLAREILGSTRWALVAPALLLANTYFLIESDGEIPLVLGEALACVVLVTFLRTIRKQSWRWALITGLLLGLTCAMDLRPAYLTVLLMAGYVLVVTLADPGWRLLGRRAALTLAALAVFGGTQLYWVLPLHFYKGHPSFPTPASPDYTILTFLHGITGVHTGWTGGAPAAFVQAPLNPMFLLLPLLAMIPLAWRRISPEMLWLALSALVCAFLAKTNNPPLGSVYQWLYVHFPGFNLFREGSKFLFIIAIAYAVLIPAALASVVELTDRTRGGTRTALRVAGAGAAALLVVVGASTLITLERGQLGSTTTPVAMPKAFKQVTAMLSADHTAGPVLWFGGPVYTTGTQGEQKNHSYTVASATHSLDNLNGAGQAPMVQDRDVLQYYCPTIADQYCYVNPAIFPYLTSMVGAAYIVSPGTSDVGQLPVGITPSWLRQRLTSMFGPPTTYGDPQTQLLVWHLSHPQPSIASYRSVALVPSGPWSLQEVLPALQALGIPAAYQQTYDANDYPPAPSTLPDSVTVVPRVDGSCAAPASMTAAIMARSSDATLTVKADGHTQTLPVLDGASRAPGWSFYGPMSLSAATTSIAPTQASQTLGPCVAWTALTKATLAAPLVSVGPTKTQANGEQLVAAAPAAIDPWVELRRTYDPGWHLRNHKPLSVAEGIFNLYGPVTPTAHGGKLKFTFSTLTWEHRGTALSLLVAIGALGGALLLGRRERRRPGRPERIAPPLEGRVATWLALGGVAFLALSGLAATASWLGLPSRLPRFWFVSDPYNVDTEFAEIALALLAGSVIARVIENLLIRHRTQALARTGAAPAAAARAGRAAGVAAGISAMALIVAGCGITGGGGANQALSNAAAAGATSPNVEGANLIAARVDQNAKNAERCVKQYTVALRSYTTLVSAWVGRGTCYQSGGMNLAAAVHDFTRALTLSPGNPVVLLDRASADQGVGDQTAADRDYQAAAFAASSTAVDVLNSVDGLLSLGEIADAQKVVTSSESRFPSSPVILAAAYDSELANGDDAQALKDLATADRLAQSMAASYELASVLSRVCGYQVVHFQYSDALTTCRQAAMVNADGSGAYDNLSVADSQLGNTARSIADLTAAIGAFQGNVSPTAQPAGVDGFGLAYLLEAQGRLYLDEHQPAKAIADYRAARAALPPGSADFAARLKADVKAATISAAFRPPKLRSPYDA